jgi:hypothetical protein
MSMHACATAMLTYTILLTLLVGLTCQLLPNMQRMKSSACMTAITLSTSGMDRAPHGLFCWVYHLRPQGQRHISVANAAPASSMSSS